MAKLVDIVITTRKPKKWLLESFNWPDTLLEIKPGILNVLNDNWEAKVKEAEEEGTTIVFGFKTKKK